VFTGLVETVGTISALRKTEAGVELRIDASYDDLAEGESVSVSGCCLTVLDHAPGWFTVAAATMTIGRTAIGRWKQGTRVNLERAMRADSRFGGHIVQGHVDGVAAVARVEASGDAVLVDIDVGPDLSKTLVLHGSVAIDGVSLTVNALNGDKLQVALIDYTLRHTSLGDLKAGGDVHVETDVIGKYLQRLAGPYLNR
jgi:riboflavin synthase